MKNRKRRVYDLTAETVCPGYEKDNDLKIYPMDYPRRIRKPEMQRMHSTQVEVDTITGWENTDCIHAKIPDDESNFPPVVQDCPLRRPRLHPSECYNGTNPNDDPEELRRAALMSEKDLVFCFLNDRNTERKNGVPIPRRRINFIKYGNNVRPTPEELFNSPLYVVGRSVKVKSGDGKFLFDATLKGFHRDLTQNVVLLEYWNGEEMTMEVVHMKYLV